ncbi:MAG: DUF1566 domain-containing protein [Gammaproteobacteria bacterium]|nr:DUF1566 domain-containing protein [Gammaproteobacteria bacterium]
MSRFALATGGTLLLSMLGACSGGGPVSEPSSLPAEGEEGVLPPTSTTDNSDHIQVVKLNDTGVVWGGNFPKGRNNACIGEAITQQDCSLGRDLAYSDDEVGHAGFDFTKLDVDGGVLLAEAEQWHCVQDNVTGLVWEIKTNDGGLHDNQRTYRWGGVGADHYAVEFYRDWDELVAGSNTEKLCGYGDWRVPRVDELISIVNFNTINPSIDDDYFPNTRFLDGMSGYWSVSASAEASVFALHVSFDDGSIGPVHRNGSEFVRLVRGAQ